MNLGKESEVQEFKISLSQLDKGIKSLTAMLNRSGRGRVYFGVDDNGNVTGIDIGKDTLMNIRNRIRDTVAPQILSEIESLCDENGQCYISVTAYGTDIPYSCDGRYFIRNVSADESVSNELLRKMLAAGDADIIRQITAEQQELTFYRLTDMLNTRGIHTSASEAFTTNYGLKTRDGRYNLMAFLLSDQNSFAVKVVRFAGNNKAEVSERTEYSGESLLTAMQAVLDHFKSINITKVVLREGIRQEIPLFGFEPFREAWINACLHNNWTERIAPSVFVFDDRIEIVSYGGLPYGLSKESFFKGTSLPVNKSLLTVFIAAGFAEQSGHGIPIIVSEYGEEAFNFDDGMVKVTIPFTFEPEQVAARRMRRAIAEAMKGNKRAVFDYLAAHPYGNLQDAADSCGLSLSGVKKITAQLREDGLLVHTGSKSKGKWIVFSELSDTGKSRL